MRRRMVAGFALALVALVAFLGAVGPGRVAADLAGIRPAWTAAAALLAPGAFLAWSESLRQLSLAHDGRVPPVRFRLAYFGGVFAKLVLPAGTASGPALVAYAVNAESNNRYEQDLAAATVAELFNLATSTAVAAAGLAVLAGTGGAGPALLAVAAAVGAGGVAAAGVLGLLFVRRSAFDALVLAAARLAGATAGRLSARLAAATDPGRVRRWLDSFGDALAAVAADRRAVAVGLAYSLVGWGCVCLALYASAVALDSPVPLALALLAVPVGGFATAIPLPGGVGGVEPLTAALLAAFAGVDAVAATATVLLFRLVSFWLVVAAGGIAAAYLSVNVREMPRNPVDAGPRG